MNKLIISLLLVFLIVLPSYAIADPSTYLNIPPTNAFDKIHSDNGTISAVNFSMPLTVKGGSGISVQSSNASHTLTITNTATPNTHNGSYNTTQANNVNINSGGSKINFINGTGATVHLQNSGSGNQVNVTVSATGVSSGVSSLNALTGALTIACVSGNTTCTTSGGNTITVNTAYNIVTTGLSAQIITKSLTLNALTLGGNAAGGNKNFTGLNQVNATKFYQGTNHVIDTLNQGSGISITGSGNSRTISNTGILSAVTSINSQTGPAVSIVRQPSYTTITNNTNSIKVGIDATGVMELNGTQTATGSKTFNALVLGGNANVGTNALTNLGHKSTLPLTTGIICQTNMTGTCGVDVNKGSYNTTQANNVNKNTNGFKLNFINGSNSIVNVLDSKSSTQVNVTISGDLTNTWQFVGRTTLGSASTSITLSGLTVYKYLWIVCYLQSDNSGSLIYPNLRFNSDSGSDYNYGRSYNAAAKASASGTTFIELSNTAANENFTSNIYVDNIKTAKKIVKAVTTSSLTNDEQTSALWTNQVNNITEVDIVSTSGTSKYATGSEIIVFGKN